MNTRTSLLFLITGLLLVACSPSGAPSAEATPPPVVADSTIVAEGRVEPISYADVAYNAGGVVSDVLVKEG
ncbi:MAG: hypothetical protein ACM3XO_08390, partial [Bacteroidota bacterium]